MPISFSLLLLLLMPPACLLITWACHMINPETLGFFLKLCFIHLKLLADVLCEASAFQRTELDHQQKFTGSESNAGAFLWSLQKSLAVGGRERQIQVVGFKLAITLFGKYMNQRKITSAE